MMQLSLMHVAWQQNGVLTAVYACAAAAHQQRLPRSDAVFCMRPGRADCVDHCQADPHSVLNGCGSQMAMTMMQEPGALIMWSWGKAVCCPDSKVSGLLTVGVYTSILRHMQAELQWVCRARPHGPQCAGPGKVELLDVDSVRKPASCCVPFFKALCMPKPFACKRCVYLQDKAR